MHSLIHNKKILISFFTIFLLASTAVSAKTNLTDIGPKIGEKAPAITAIDTKKQTVNIKQLSRDKGLIILFFRSADWCPFCKKHLIELNNHADKFNQLGYGLTAISYDDTNILKNFTEQENISYPLLADQKVQTVLAYDVVNQQYQPGDDNYGIPYPGVVVIDENGVVTHKRFFKGYKKRVKFDELYRQLSLEK